MKYRPLFNSEFNESNSWFCKHSENRVSLQGTVSPSWIEDAPKDARKKQVLGLEDAPKSLKN